MNPGERLVVGGWLAGPDGVEYYRMRLPLDELGRCGHAVQYARVLPWRAGKRPASHVLVGQCVSNEGPTRQWQDAARGVRRVFELDDDLLHVDSSNPAAPGYREPGRRARLLGNLLAADAVTTTTEYLAGVLREQYGITAPVHVLPNCLDRQVMDVPPVDQDGPVTIGWAGSDSHIGDFELVRRPLRRFLNHHPHVGLTFMGADFRHLMGTPWAAWRPWVTVWADPVGYMKHLDWQIGIAPLANTQFNRCKSALKALEYGARGIVVVASDVEPYRRFVRHGETGFLVSRDHEWGAFLTLLVRDGELRAQMAAAAREQARAWTIDRHIHLWEAAYRGEGGA